jgi:hypothetical protein
MSQLEQALQRFEATEANLGKLERLWSQIERQIPNGPAFGAPSEYGENCMAFRRILPALPAIDGFRVEDHLFEFDAAGQMRLDALELEEIGAHVSVSNALEEQGRQLREYRFRLSAKRRELVRNRMVTLIDEVDATLRALVLRTGSMQINERAPEPDFSRIKAAVGEIAALVGSNPKPPRWTDLHRHLSFAQVSDVNDIERMDWPAVKAGLRLSLYGEHDPLPVDVDDLGRIVAARPQGAVTARLNWASMSDEEFERLIFALIAETAGYENPQWLQQTNAADRGRDLSVSRAENDPLGGVRRHRVIIQCKHWNTRSISVSDVSGLRAQMELWAPPRVDGLIITTTGRFTADAIAYIERHNQEGRALHISMWPDSHLEMLLAARPHLIAQFHLRYAPGI